MCDGPEDLPQNVIHTVIQLLSSIVFIQDICSVEKRKPVCGHNGHTYTSVCAAWADRITVDYYGPCQTVGKLLGEL